MGRFYKNYIERLLLGLVLLIELEKQAGVAGVVAAVKKYRTDSSAESDILYNAMCSYSTPDENNVTNAEVMAAGIGQMRRNKKDDVDLIETVVRVLQLPFSVNRFSVTTLKYLRDAIMRPDELGAFKKAMKEEVKCSCGHAFHSNELVTSVYDGDRGLKLVCHRCTRPSTVPCDICGEQTALVGKVASGHLKDVDCGCVKRAERLAAQQAELIAAGVLPTDTVVNPTLPPPPTGAPQLLTYAQMRERRAVRIIPFDDETIPMWNPPPNDLNDD